MFDLNKKDPARADSGQPSATSRDSQPTGASYATTSRPAGGAGMAVIGRSIQIVGDVRGDEDLCIEGDIDGNIHLPNHSLTIGTEGRIRADAYAKSVIIDGEINGDVYGSECVTIRAKARVSGNILASRVSLEEGARFKGSIDMDSESVKAALEKVQATVRSSRPQTGASGRANGASVPHADKAAAQASSGKSPESTV
jgi:cytoskeletal protein CcmA (bactofilin family)